MGRGHVWEQEASRRWMQVRHGTIIHPRGMLDHPSSGVLATCCGQILRLPACRDLFSSVVDVYQVCAACTDPRLLSSLQGQLRARREAERRREKAEQKQEQARRRAQSGKGRHSIQTRRLYVGVHRPYPEQEEPPFIGRTSRNGPTSGRVGD